MNFINKLQNRWMSFQKKQKKLKTYHIINAQKANELSPVKGKNVLIVGCSTGIDCQLFIQYGAMKVDGVDLSDSIGVDYKHDRVRYFKMNVENLDGINDQNYDLVYCLATLEHVSDIKKALFEMVRVAKTNAFIYSYSAPLWNSSQGHHKSIYFKDYPWIHLRLRKDEIVEYCKMNQIKDKAKKITMEQHIEYMLDNRFFNMEPSTKYIEVSENLYNVTLIKNCLAFDPDSLLTDKIFNQLNPKGFTREELLANGHILIAKKK